MGFSDVYEVAKAAEYVTDLTRIYISGKDVIKPVISLIGDRTSFIGVLSDLIVTGLTPNLFANSSKLIVCNKTPMLPIIEVG